jgi:kynureninase
MVLDAIDPACLQAPADPALRGGTLVLKFPDQEQVETRLRAAGVRFDSRPRGLRLSPHIYNTAQEMQVVVECFARHA